MGKIQVKICCGIHCSIHGGQEIGDIFENDVLLANNCEFNYTKCLNCCDDGRLSPVIEINGQIFTQMTPERVLDHISSLVETK